MKDQQTQYSIYNYLGFPGRAWNVEFESSDFGASLAEILELPPKVYEMNTNLHFWAFMKQFVYKCEICFIFRKHASMDIPFENIELALIGWWNNNQFAIPLWILNNYLLGFEVISYQEYDVLSSEELKWDKSTTIYYYKDSPELECKNSFIMDNSLFTENKIFFQIYNGEISKVNALNELDFFRRISDTEIPDFDDPSKT